MKSSISNRIRPVTAMAAVGILAVAGLSSCGSGKQKFSADNQPAPQTFNGIVLTTFPGGPTFRFIRAEGDAMSGVELGAMTMDREPFSTNTVSSGGTASLLVPPTSTSGARYEYIRNSPESGTLIVRGESSGVTARKNWIGNPPFPPPVNYLQSTFERRFELLFGTDGTRITGITYNDSGEDQLFPGILWTGATIRLQNNQPVPIGYSLSDSEGLDLPKVYPESVSMQVMLIFPDDFLEDGYSHQLLESTFTRFSSSRGDFIEKGVGNRNILGLTELEIINFEYNPDPATTNLAEMRITDEAGTVFTYNFRFLDLEKGEYEREDGSTGTFEFPFLD